MTGPELSVLLATVGISGRELARRLGVSAMWVSRRASGEVEITDEEADAILAAISCLACIGLGRPCPLHRR